MRLEVTIVTLQRVSSLLRRKRAGPPAAKEAILNDDDLRPGDVVLLTSGSPKLTITAVDPELAWVTWHENGSWRTAAYPRSTLTIHIDDPSV